jgi:ribonuclease HI
MAQIIQIMKKWKALSLFLLLGVVDVTMGSGPYRICERNFMKKASSKASIEKKIKELSRVLTSTKAKTAIEILLAELKNYSEPKAQEVTTGTSHLVLETNVAGKTNAYALYTDGACRGNPGPGSYAYIVQDCEAKIVKQFADYSDHTTNNKMELKAIIEGLKSLKDTIGPMHEVYIYTDSKYAVDGMKSWVAGWKKRGWKKADKKAPENLDLWKELDSLTSMAHLHFNWVKGHSGHPQNEYVDNLANIVLDDNGY